MNRFVLNHSYFPNGCAPDSHLPIKSSGQSNRKKPAIICRILARAIWEHVVQREDVLNIISSLFISSYKFISEMSRNFSATTYFEWLLRWIYLCWWSIARKNCISFVVIDESFPRRTNCQNNSVIAWRVVHHSCRVKSKALKIVAKC